jgi:hypothetical protein
MRQISDLLLPLIFGFALLALRTGAVPVCSLQIDLVVFVAKCNLPSLQTLSKRKPASDDSTRPVRKHDLLSLAFGPG